MRSGKKDKPQPKHIGGLTSLLVIGGVTAGCIFLGVNLSEDWKSGGWPNSTPTPTPKPVNEKVHREQIAQFMETVTVADRHTVIAGLESSGDDTRELTITVNAHWDALPYATRLEYAKTFRGAWKGIWNGITPTPGGAKVRIKIVNAAGKTIGEGTWSEDAIWVE